MGEEVILSFLNLDDYLEDENVVENFIKINKYILKEKDKYDAWKAVVVLHSRLCSYELEEIYDMYSDNRVSDDIILGKFQANDLYSHYYYDFELVNGVDYRKKRIFDSTIYYYKDFLKIKKVVVFDRNINLKEKDLKDIFDKYSYEVVNPNIFEAKKLIMHN